MKLRLFIFFLALYTLITAAAPESNGWRDMLKDRLASSLSTPPRVESKVEGRSQVIRVTNVSKATLSYSARGAASPVLYFERYQDGAWRASGWDRCGTGVEEFTVKPGDSVEMELYSGQIEEGTRIFTIFTDKEGKRSSAVLLIEKEPNKALEPRPCLSHFVLTHELRQAWSRLSFDVRQNYSE